MKNKKGFTLIELMIILAIIGMLVAFAVPQIQSWKSSRNQVGFVQPQPVSEPAQAQAPALFVSGGYKIKYKGFVGNQEVTVFEHDGSEYLITYSGCIIQRR